MAAPDLGKDATLDNQNDQEFAAVISAIANLRKSDRSVSIEVTQLLQPMVDRLTLTGFRNYVLGRYPVDRGTSAYGKYDFVDLPEQVLKSYDSVFFYLDRLRIGFDYVDDWETPTKFRAILRNDQL